MSNVQELAKVLIKANGSNSYIFSGIKGIGKAFTAQALVKNILHCDQDYSPNLLWLDTAKDKVSVEEIRAIYDFITKTSYSSLPKVIVIDALDDLNIHSLNALLKLLEEPMNNSYFILISHNIGALLKTVRSRCINIRFNAPDHALTHNIIKDAFPSLDDTACEDYAYLAHHIPGTAINLINSNALVFYRQMLEVMEVFNTNAESLYSFIDSHFSSNAKKDESWQIFKILISHLLKLSITASDTYTSKRMDGVEKKMVENLRASRSMDDLLSLNSYVNQLFYDTDFSNLSIANVILIVFYKIVLELP